MTHLRTRPLEHVSGALNDQIADELLSLLPPGRPRRVARMLDYQPGSDKYRDIPRSRLFTRTMLLNHASGHETWATTLDRDGSSRLGVIEVDSGGRAAVLAVLAAAHERGLVAVAIAVDNPLIGHTGGHVWFMYAELAPIAAIVAQLRAVTTAAGRPADSEIWPCNQVIRLPFGYHRWAQTRGELLTQAGELVDLDADLAGGFDLVRSLPQNSAPVVSAQADIALDLPVVTPVVTTCATFVTGVTTQDGARRVSPGELSAERASLADVRHAFNRDHKLSSLLELGPGGLYFCPCGQHSSGKPKITIWETDGEERAQSYSPDCVLFPLHRSGKYLTAFGYYVATEHGGNVTTALKTLNPISRSNSAPARSLPEYLTPAAAAKRQADRERARTNRRTRSQARMRKISALSEQFATSKACPYDRTLWAYHQRRWEDRGTPEHVDSNERIARAVLELDRSPTKTELRRLKLAHQRLISRGYLVRTIRYKPGEHNTNCWQPGDGYMVILPVGETITMVDHESESCLDSGACERGADPAQPDRALLGCVRELAGRAAEPGWETRDYAELDDAGLEAEADRLLAVVAAQLADGVSGEFPQMPKSEIISDSQIENPAAIAGAIVTGPAGALATIGGAAYVPKGAERWYQAMQIPKFLEFDGLAEDAHLLDLAPEPAGLVEPERAAPVRRRRPREISALDGYRLDLAGMEETVLAGELKKHQRTLKKHAGAHWLDQVRAKLALVQSEIDVRELATLAGAPLPSLSPGRRPQAARSSEIPRMPAGAQLLLDLGPVSASANRFERAPIEGSPPLTSSSAFEH